jgi:hypothetical protein
MRSVLLWRAGSIGLAIAGVLGAAGVVLSDAVPGAVWTGIWLVAAARLLGGLALAATGVAMGRRLPACVLLMVAGGLLAVVGVADLLVAGLVLPPGWATVAITVLAHLAVLAAAIATAVRGRLVGVAGWALLVPGAAVVVLDGLSWSGAGIPLWWAVCLADLLFAAVGVVWAGAAQPKVKEYAASPGLSAMETVPSRAEALDATV